MGFDDFDNVAKGQMTIDDLFAIEIPENVFAVSKIFARARKQMNLAELKAFTYALTNFRYTEECKNTMMLDKKTVATIVGINSDYDHLSVDLKRSIGQLPEHSKVEFEDKDSGFYENGFIINKIRMYKDKVWLKFDEDYIKLFTQLEKDYIRMWSGDIFSMTSERSITFYEHLRLNTDTRESVCFKGFGIRALKELFDIPKEGKGSYMRDAKNGGFNRAEFEKKIIEPLCEDLSKTKMITLVLQKDGKYYEKVYQGKRVAGYRFHWTYSNAPAVATATEVKQIQEKVDKNPQVLKIAKDIIKGEKKKSPLKGSFHNFPQQDYDFEALERLVKNQTLEDLTHKSKEMTEEQKESYNKLTEGAEQLSFDDIPPHKTN